MRSRARDGVALALGSAVSGLLAYAVFALSTRALGAAAASPVSVLWSYWSFAGAALTFPVQHWIARTVTAHGDQAVRSAAAGLAGLAAAVSVASGVVAWLIRVPLFGRDDVWFPVMVALVTLGSTAVGVVRGGLSARDRLVAVGGSLVVENGVRCAAVAALYASGDRSAVAYGWCLVAGHLVVVLWPSAFRYRRGHGTAPASGPFAFLAGAGAGQLVAQTLLTGGPVVLALSGGSARQVTALFAALALFRAPYMLALGLVAGVTARVTRFVVAGQGQALRALRTGLLLATAAGVALAVAVGAWAGPRLLTLVFGADVLLDRGQAAVVAVGCTVAVANLALVVVALAHDRAGTVARAWAAASLAAATAYVALSARPALEQVTWAFLAGEVLALAWLAVTGRATTTGASTRPGAPTTRRAGPGGAAPDRPGPTAP